MRVILGGKRPYFSSGLNRESPLREGEGYLRVDFSVWWIEWRRNSLSGARTNDKFEPERTSGTKLETASSPTRGGFFVSIQGFRVSSGAKRLRQPGVFGVAIRSSILRYADSLQWTVW